MAGLKLTTFDNDDLDLDFKFTWQHNLGTESVVPLWIDADGSVRNSSEVFTIIDSDTIEVSTGGSITGEHTLIVMYDNIVALNGRKLFALSLITDPDEDMRVAIGKDGVLSSNMTLESLVDWITTNSQMLTIAKISNLSAASKQSLRDSLQVYSKTQTNSSFSRIFTGTVQGAILSNNTIPHTPSNKYNPITANHVSKGGMRKSGTISDVDRWSGITSVTTRYHAVRNSIVKLNLQIVSSGGTSGGYTPLGRTNILPQVDSGDYLEIPVQNALANIYESGVMRIYKDTGFITVNLHAAGTWIVDTTYFIDINTVNDTTFIFS